MQQSVQRLIKKIAHHPSTEELILFIAGDNDITHACVELQQRLDTKHNLRDIEDLCLSYQLPMDLLARELQRITAIFSPETISDEYVVLGLNSNADITDVKQAFRRLSLKYHPDSSKMENSDKFIEICQAYKTIISQTGANVNSYSNQQNGWRKQMKKRKKLTRRQKRKSIILYSCLALFVCLILLTVPLAYKKRVVLQNLNSNGTGNVIQPMGTAQVQEEQPDSRPQSVTDKNRNTAETAGVEAALAKQQEEQKERAKALALEKQQAEREQEAKARNLAKQQAEREEEEKALALAHTAPPLPTSLSLNRFFYAYATAYGGKNIDQFSTFFTADARENGQLFIHRHQEYVKLFNAVDDISLEISILNTDWQHNDIKISGRFQLTLSYPRSEPVQSRGRISFLLTNNKQNRNLEYLVKTINYSFD